MIGLFIFSLFWSIFCSVFSICSLNNLEPLFLCLSLDYLIKSSVLNVLTPIRIRSQRYFFIFNTNRILFIKIIYFLIVEFEIFIPNSLKFTKLSNSLFLCGISFFGFRKRIKKIRSYLIKSSFKEITRLILFGKKTFFTNFKIQFHKYSFLFDPIISYDKRK